MKKVVLYLFLVFLPIILVQAQTNDSMYHLSPTLSSGSNFKVSDSSSIPSTTNFFKGFVSSKAKSNLKLPVGSLKKKKKIEIHGRIFSDVNYVNDNTAPTQYNGMYTRSGIAPSLKVLGIPLSGEFSIATQNNQARFDYSTASMQFDIPQYHSQLKDSYLKYISDFNHFFSTEEALAVSKVSDTIKRMENCEKMISSSDYDKNLNSLIGQAKAMEDSSNHQPMDSTKSNQYKTLTDSIKTLQAYAKDYQLAQQYLNGHQQDLKKYYQYQDFIKTVKGTSDITDIPRVAQDLKTKNLLDKKNSFLAGIQKFSLGKVNLNYSPFTIYNQNIYGLNIEYLIHNTIFVGGGAGVPTAFNFGFSPQFFTQTTNTIRGINRFLAFLRVGVGKVKGNHLHLIYYAYSQKFNSSSTYAMNMPPANSVVSLELLQNISKDIKFTSEAALSNSSYLFRSASFAPVGRDDSSKALVFNYAFRAALDGVIKKTFTTFNVKFQMTSNDFITIGNPYLRRGYMEFSAMIKQELFNKKVTLSDVITQSISGLQLPGNTFQIISNNIAVNYKAGSKANFTVSYIYMRDVPLGSSQNPSDFLSHTVNLVQTYTAKIKKTKATTSITSVFIYNENKGNEFNTNNMGIQNGVKESLAFKNGITFQPGLGIIYSNYGNLPTSSTAAMHCSYWVEAGNSFNIKKGISIQYTARYNIDQVLGNALNISSSINAKVYKTFQINVKGQIMAVLGTSTISAYQNINLGGGLSYGW